MAQLATLVSIASDTQGGDVASNPATPDPPAYQQNLILSQSEKTHASEAMVRHLKRFATVLLGRDQSTYSFHTYSDH